MILLLRSAFFASLGAITILAFLPDYSALPPVVSYSDLANHTVAFTVLFLLYAYAYTHPRKRIFISLLAYGVWIETVQAFLPTRYASAEDILADMVGLVIGLGVVKGLEKIPRSAPKGQES
ncbi:MAG: VanZ family protein [Campylobacterales bacterium]|nr:VanZ family protein [Campylobacterales bacterium]